MQDTQAAELRQKHRQHIRNIAHTAQPNHGTALIGTVLVGVNLILEELDRLNGLELPFPDMASDVATFHAKFGIDYQGPARFLPPDVEEFRNKFNHEELEEYELAEKLEEKLDAGLDQIYVILGNLHLHGFTPAQINEGWRRVQAANMAKVRSSDANPSKRGANGLDIVKPANWQAPNLADLVTK